MPPRVVALLFFLLALLPGEVRAEYFTIESYSSLIEIRENSRLLVREELAVRFSRPRHGIYRDLPFRYTSDTGGDIRTPLEVHAVMDGGDEPRPYKILREQNSLRVRIGHPDRLVRGSQVYVILYEVSNALLFFDENDELAWNVTGNDWRTTIDRVRAEVLLPEAVADAVLSSSCYTGVYGSTESACAIEREGRLLRFRSLGKLSPHAGMTVSVGFPKEIVREPTALRRLVWSLALRENWVFVLPFLGFIFAYGHWRAVGRDPDPHAAVPVMYAPPKHGDTVLTAAEVGGLVDERFNPRDITGAVVGLAVKGYLSIEEKEERGILSKKKDFFIRREKPPDGALTPFETKLMKALVPSALPGVLISSLKDRFYLEIDTLKDLLYDSLVDKGYFRVRPRSVQARYVGYGIVTAILGFLAALAASRLLPATVDIKNIVAFVLPGLILLLFARHMPVKTFRGARAARRVRGFEEFLDRAEKDRLERMKDLNLFEKYLPYAIALNVSDRWAEAFEGIDQTPPSWYRGASRWDGGFRPATFSDSLNTALGTMGTQMYSAPRSSGGSGGFSSGGGFSGGGFGGGGGGSW